MRKKNKFFLIGSIIVFSSFVVYKSFKQKEKLAKEKRYKLFEAILVDPDYN